jgi:hypothetical protein
MAVLLAQNAGAATERQDFSTWTMSNSSVVGVGDQLTIGTGDGNSDWAKKAFSIDLTAGTTIILEQRIKLESGGLNYRLPGQDITFEDSSVLDITYLFNTSPNTHGWDFGGWTGIDTPEVPGAGWWTSATADYWTVTRIVLTSTGGELFMKPDDAAQGWFSNEFTSITSDTWVHSQITEIAFGQPWDSVNYVDYMDITIVPEPSTALLLSLGLIGIGLRKKFIM